MTTDGKVFKLLRYGRSWLPVIDCTAQFPASISALLCSAHSNLRSHLAFWISVFRRPPYPFEICWYLDSRSTVYDLRMHNLHSHPRLHDASLIKMPTYMLIIYYATSSIIPSFRSCTRILYTHPPESVHVSSPSQHRARDLNVQERSQ